jgi:protein TonB
MSGTLRPSAPTPRPQVESRDDEPIFRSLVVSDPPPPPARVVFSRRASAVVHVALIATIALVPLFMPPPPPAQPDYIRALLYDPPPPPPPPLPKGSAVVSKPEPAKPVTPEEKPETPKFTEPQTPKEETPLKPEARDRETLQAGSPTGSDAGVPEGMEGGIEGGIVGGVPGGILGGVIGGTGSIVLDWDSPPKLIKLTKPQYPQDAFVKKIEGTVELEIIIDITGRVVHARVLRSVPLLDAAAIQTVYQWKFQPAMKHGRAVPTKATAPVTFRIF